MKFNAEKYLSEKREDVNKLREITKLIHTE